VTSVDKPPRALSNRHKSSMRELNKGDKPSDEQLKLIDEATKEIAKGFEE
jgi:F-type H+/Na+-transporting ATPase subunit alpha